MRSHHALPLKFPQMHNNIIGTIPPSNVLRPYAKYKDAVHFQTPEEIVINNKREPNTINRHPLLLSFLHNYNNAYYECL